MDKIPANKLNMFAIPTFKIDLLTLSTEDHIKMMESIKYRLTLSDNELLAGIVWQLTETVCDDMTNLNGYDLAVRILDFYKLKELKIKFTYAAIQSCKILSINMLVLLRMLEASEPFLGIELKLLLQTPEVFTKWNNLRKQLLFIN